MSLLVIKARVGDYIQVGDAATLRIAEKYGQWVGLQFQADRSVRITRFDTHGPDSPRVLESRQVHPSHDMVKFGPPARVALGIVSPSRGRLKAG